MDNENPGIGCMIANGLFILAGGAFVYYNWIDPMIINRNAKKLDAISTTDVKNIVVDSTTVMDFDSKSLTVDLMKGTRKLFYHKDSVRHDIVPITRYTLKSSGHTLVITDFFNDGIAESAVETVDGKEILRLNNPRTENIDTSRVQKYSAKGLRFREYSKWYYSQAVYNNPSLNVYGQKVNFLNREDLDERIKTFNDILNKLRLRYASECASERHIQDSIAAVTYTKRRQEQITSIDAAASTSLFSDFERRNKIMEDSLARIQELTIKRNKLRADSLHLENILNSISCSEFGSSDDEVVVSNPKTSKVFTSLPKGDYVKVASKNLDVLAVNNIIFSPTEKVYTDLTLIENSYKKLTEKSAHSKTLAVLENAMVNLGNDYICVIRPRGVSSNLNANEKILSATIKEFNSESHQSPSHGYVASILFLTLGKNTGASIDSKSASKEYANYKTIQYRVTEKTAFEIYRKK
jgi:hypothetical protein